MKTYAVKCDECKEEIRRTDKARESYEGGTCEACRRPYYTSQQINECFPHKTDEWSQSTADDLNSVHSHVNALEAEGMSGEDAWAETLRVIREQRLAAMKTR